MAYVATNSQDDEEERLRREGQSINIAGETSGTSAPGSPAQKDAQAGGGFVDVATYANANRSQAKDIATKLGGRLAEERMKLEGGITDLGKSYQDQIERGRTYDNPTLRDEAFKDPASFTKDPNKLDQFRRQRDAMYTGPLSFQDRNDYAETEKRVNEAVSKAKGVDTSEGRQSMVYDLLGNPTKGQVTLDAMLVGTDPDARRILSESASPFSNLTGYLDQVRADAEGKAKVAKEGTDTARTNTLTGLREQTGKFTDDLNARLAETRSKATRDANMTREQIRTGGSLTAEEKAQLGLENWDDILTTRGILARPSPKVFPGLQDSVAGAAPFARDIDLSTYLTQQNPDVAFTRENVAGADDYAREQALQQLYGEGFDILPDDPAMAGTAPKSLLSRQGDPGKDLSDLLSDIDQSWLDTTAGFNGWPDGNTSLDSQWKQPLASDPSYAEGYQNLIDIFNRNPDKTTGGQQDFARRVGTYLSEIQDGKFTPDGGDAFDPNAGGPTGTDRLRVVDGKMSWWDGSNWTEAPPEVRRNPDTGKKERFNYSTGQYEPTVEDDGVMRKF